MTETDQKKFYQMLGARIRSARNEVGLNQETLAGFLNLTRASVVNIEKGRQRAPIYVLWQIAKVLKTEITELIPNFTSSEKIDPILEKLIVKKASADSEINPEKLKSFISEIQPVESQK